jgi:hypothetical protein
MSNVLLRNIVEVSFRANPAYELVLFDRLPPDQQDALRDLTRDPDLYGVLIPREGGGRNTKSVCRDTALLLFALNQPGPLPAYARAMLGEDCNQAIAELVLDEVLEMEHAGEFVCGAGAYDLIYHRRPAAEGECAFAGLTRAALQYGQALDIEDSGRISARLYFYNRVPVSALWKHRFPGQDAVASYLGIESGGALRRLLDGSWIRLKPSAQSEGWFQWQAVNDKTSGGGASHVYKLYVSPKPEFIREAFQGLVEVLTDSQAHHFKVGCDAPGLLRPDKMVAYFSSFESLQDAATRIGAALAGCEAQGVPFTAALQADGLLSWGIDPAPDKVTLSWQEHPSWRLWVTNRLAAALVSAKSARNSGLEPWRFALERLRLENVDTDTWTPTETFGRAEAVA